MWLQNSQKRCQLFGLGSPDVLSNDNLSTLMSYDLLFNANISIVYIGIGNVHLMTVHTDDN